MNVLVGGFKQGGAVVLLTRETASCSDRGVPRMSAKE